MIPKDYECDGQITFDEYILANKEVEHGDRGCRVCHWHNDKDGCHWKRSVVHGHEFPNCFFEPSLDVPSCSNCVWNNPYIYRIKDEYKAEEERKGYSQRAEADPVEDANIYCTHPDGSLNRRSAYEDCKRPLGIGKWHCQHEWDICDRWELDNG